MPMTTGVICSRCGAAMAEEARGPGSSVHTAERPPAGASAHRLAASIPAPRAEILPAPGEHRHRRTATAPADVRSAAAAPALPNIALAPAVLLRSPSGRHRRRGGAARPLFGWALATGAILLSLVVLRFQHILQPDLHRTVSWSLKASIAVVLYLYFVVAFATVLVVRRGRLTLHWSRGSAVVGAALGAAAGAAFGGLLLIHSQAVTGHVVIDPAITLQLSEDTWWSTVTGVLTLVVIAPVVEEVVFRGVLAESMLARGLGVAAVTSAPMFWLWHWRLSVEAFGLLAGLGALLAVVYHHRGLVGSIAAHAAYNGILVVVAVAQLSGPARPYQLDGLGLSAPGSWHVAQQSPGRLVLQGPSAATIEIDDVELDHVPRFDEIADRLRAVSAGLRGAADVRPVTLPIGIGAQVTTTSGVHRATITEVGVGRRLYAIEVDEEGSATAAREAAQILASLHTA